MDDSWRAEVVDGDLITGVTDIQAKTLMTKHANDEGLFATMYNLNLYRGCSHGCIYCDTRSECYGIVDISRIEMKANAIALLQAELPTKRVKGVVGTGSMNDPYQPVEAHANLTRRALETLYGHGFPVHVITKSALVLRDIDILADMARNLGHAAVTFSIATTDDALTAWTEPGASPPSKRLRAMRELAAVGVKTGAAVMPLLPELTDSRESVIRVVEAVEANGGQYVLPGALTLRDFGRAHLYDRLAKRAPRALAATRAIFGDRYLPPDSYARRVCEPAEDAARRLGLRLSAPRWQRGTQRPESAQLQLF